MKNGDELTIKTGSTASLVLATAIALLGPPGLAAQTNLVVTGGGTALPVAQAVAPGEVTTLFVAGASVLEPIVAETASLPTSLGGVSVSIRQSRGSVLLLEAPLFTVWPVSTCETGLALACAGDPLTAVTLQIPFDLFPNAGGETPIGGSEAVLTVAQDGRSSGEFRVRPVLDRVHVLNTCDGALPFDFRGDPACRPIVTHADGSLVTASNPAVGGETLIAYAFGLGTAGPDVVSGSPAPPLASDSGMDTARFRLRFDFSPNASPSRPADFESAPRPLFAGLAPGFVGLYQVNFRTPEPPADLPRCVGSIESNLTVGIAGAASFDGAALCVAP